MTSSQTDRPTPASRDLTGQKFNRLTVLDHNVPEHYRKRKDYGSFWRCRCDCGNISYVLSSHLRNGQIKSCGCLRDEKATINLIHAREVYKHYRELNK